MKKSAISLIETKLFSLIDLTYQLIKASIFFWVTLIKNFIFFGLTVSLCTLHEVIDEVLTGNGRPIRKLFNDISPKYKQNKRLSLVTIGLIIYFSMFFIIRFPSSISINTISVIKFALLYLFLLTLVLFTYITWVIVKMELSLKQTIMYSFYLMMKQFFRSIILVLMFIALMYLSHMNFIFLIFFAPALYACCVRLVLKNSRVGTRIN